MSDEEQPAGLVARLDAKYGFNAKYHRAYAWFERRPGSGFVLAVVQRWRRVNASVLSGHVAFRAFILLVPLLVVVIGVLGFLRRRGIDVGTAADERFGVGGVLQTAIAEAGADAAVNQVTVNVVAVTGLIIATYGLLKACRAVFAFAWGIPQDEVRKGTVALLPRFVGGLVVFVVALLARQWIAQSGFTEAVAAALGSFVTGSLVFLALSWILPRRTDRWRDLLPGALVVGVGTTLLSVVGAWYFSGRIARSSETYGTVGIVVSVLLYLFLLAQLIVGAAVTNAEWVERSHARTGADADALPPSV